MNWYLLGLAGASLPALAYIGFNQGINSFLTNQQERQEVNLMFTKSDNSFHKRAVIPPIRRFVYPDFTIYYSTILRIPLAVKERFTKSDLQNKKSQNQTTYPLFRETLIKNEFAVEDSSYNNSEKVLLVSGQLASPDGKSNPRDAYTYANTIPQNKDNRLDVWETFENYQKQLTNRCDSVDVISGPLFTHENGDASDPESQWKIYDMSYKKLGKYGPAVPPKLFKIIRCSKGNESFVSGFVFNNESSNVNSKLMKSFQSPIQQISQKTGLALNLPGTSLTQFEPSVFSKTKEEYDRTVYEEPIINAQNYNSIKGLFKHLRNHKIEESEKVLNSVKKNSFDEMQRIAKDEKIAGCDKIEEYLKMRIDLGDSKSIKQINQELKKLEDKAYKVCANPIKLMKIKETLVSSKNKVPGAAERIKEIDQIFDKKLKHQMK